MRSPYCQLCLDVLRFCRRGQPQQTDSPNDQTNQKKLKNAGDQD